MTKTRWLALIVFAVLAMALPAAAGTDECVGQSDGTSCTDRDDNPCTLALCTDEDCEQDNAAPGGTVCCTDGTNPDPPGTTCPDTDGDDCSSAACNAAGDCNQTSSRMLDGTECPDTDGNVNTIAACFGGMCDQTFSVAGASAAPAMSTMGGAFIVAILAALGYRRLRRAV